MNKHAKALSHICARPEPGTDIFVYVQWVQAWGDSSLY